jgi:16S rRNA (guanine527-N7)-methyltransferase
VSDWASLQEWSRVAAGLELSDIVVGQLRQYVEALRIWNRKMALVARADLSIILDKHVADSLFAAAHCPANAAVADLGSGAGFPGMVIAIVRPAAHVALIEARGKKVSFLEEACRVAGIRNAAPVHARIEEAALTEAHQHRYDWVTSRALTDLDELRGLATPLAVPGARLVAMRSAAADIPAGAERLEYLLPDGTPRALVTSRLA